MSKKRPTLLLLDFTKDLVTRYWPKIGDARPTAFLTQTAQIYKLDGVWMLGGKDGLTLLEEFRSGKLDVKPILEPELEQA